MIIKIYACNKNVNEEEHNFSYNKKIINGLQELFTTYAAKKYKKNILPENEKIPRISQVSKKIKDKSNKLNTQELKNKKFKRELYKYRITKKIQYILEKNRIQNGITPKYKRINECDMDEYDGPKNNSPQETLNAIALFTNSKVCDFAKIEDAFKNRIILNDENLIDDKSTSSQVKKSLESYFKQFNNEALGKQYKKKFENYDLIEELLRTEKDKIISFSSNDSYIELLDSIYYKPLSYLDKIFKRTKYRKTKYKEYKK